MARGAAATAILVVAAALRAAAEETPPLEGTTWRVEALPGQDAGALAAARPALNVRFDAGRIEGFSGCNRFAGGYAREGDRIRLGSLAGTMMACSEPAMVLESAFRSALAGTLRYAIADGRLRLTSESGATTTLRAEPAPRLGIDTEAMRLHLSAYQWLVEARRR